MNKKMITEANDRVDSLYKLFERIRLTLQLCRVYPRAEVMDLVEKGIAISSQGFDEADALSRMLHLAVVVVSEIDANRSLLDSLNELSKPEASHDDETIRRVVWKAVERLRDAEGLITELLNDQETLAKGIRNEALVEKCKKFLGEK